MYSHHSCKSIGMHYRMSKKNKIKSSTWSNAETGGCNLISAIICGPNRQTAPLHSKRRSEFLTWAYTVISVAWQVCEVSGRQSPRRGMLPSAVTFAPTGETDLFCTTLRMIFTDHTVICRFSSLLRNANRISRTLTNEGLSVPRRLRKGRIHAGRYGTYETHSTVDFRLQCRF